MAQILENEFCNECKEYKLTEEYHMWGVEKYCTSCGYKYTYVIEDEVCLNEE